ncbi:MAG: C39 family peptidase [Vicinamibacterales bacterium]
MRLNAILTALVLALAASGTGGAAATAAELSMIGFGGNFNVPVTSIREGRFQTVIRQEFDFSCGSAALASLLTYHYERPTTEHQVFVSMYEAGDQEKIQQQGFSLLDMKTYLARQGLTGDGFQMTLDKVAEIGVPVITLINLGGYRHFVVVKGVRDGEVVVGDPALGVRIYKADVFQAIWSGVVFLIRNDAKLARTNFNNQRDWRVRQKAPFGTALTQNSLANFTLFSTFMPNEF